MGNSLSLSQAAKFAGVTQVTMRKWVDDIEGVTRKERGEYQIPHESLMKFLALKAPKVRGAVKAKVTATSSTESNNFTGYLQGQLVAKDRMIDELRAELKEAQSDVRKLEAELRSHLSGNGLSKALSRWFRV